MMTTPTMTMSMTSAIMAAIQPQQKEDLLAGKTIKVRLNDFVVAEFSLETELGQIIAALVQTDGSAAAAPSPQEDPSP